MLVKMLNWSAASGSLGGYTTQSSPSGQIVRKRPMPVNPNTELQIEARDFLSAASANWADLEATQRQGWDEYAANVQIKNRLGDMVYITGKSHYCRTGTALLRVGELLPTYAPTIFSLGEKDTTVVVTEQDGSEVGPPAGVYGKLSVAFDKTNGPGWAVEANAFLMVFISAPQNPTINYCKGPYRYAGKIEGTSPGGTTSPVLMTNPFVGLAEGQKQFGYTRVLRADGRLSEKQFFTVTVPENLTPP